MASRVLGEIRKAKSDAKRSMRVDVASVVVTADETDLTALRGAIEDVKAAGRVADLTLAEGPDDSVTVEVTLAET
jgi:valyl-tRNA synthetase